MTRTGIALLATAAFCTVTQVQAAPITYSLSTTASGRLGASTFTNALVTVTLTGDTSNITSDPGPIDVTDRLPSGWLANPGTATVSISGLGTATFTGSMVMLSTFNEPSPMFFGVPAVLILELTDGTGVLAQQGPVLFGYDLRSSLGPVTGTGGSSAPDPNATFATTRGTLLFTAPPIATGTTTFTAVATPEPRLLALTQSGFTFQAVQGGGAPSPRSFRVLNGTAAPLPFTVTASTVSGGAWLSVSPVSGSSDPSQAPPTIDVSVNPANLARGDYYGQVQVAPPAPNSPQSVTVVLNVVAPNVNPGPVVEPTGLVFVGVAGGAAPSPQTTRITNLTSRPTAFVATPSFAGTQNWYTAGPVTGNVAPGQPVAIQVSPNAGLASGVYRGALPIDFPQDATSRVVDLLLVVVSTLPPAAEKQDASQRTTSHGCQATRLLPVSTLLGRNFNSPVSWPVPIEAIVVDDCGALLRNGSVIASFSNGDPPLPLLSDRTSRWSGTWNPRNPRNTATTVTLTAHQPAGNLTATVEVGGGTVAENVEVPAVNARGMVSAASYAATAAPSPGELVSVFGKKLADGIGQAAALPLPASLQGAILTLGGRVLPLVFTSEGQLNAMVPYDLTSGETYQLISRRGNRISVPEPITIKASQPAIFSRDLSGRGQGHVYVFPSATEQVLADAANPARAGDFMVLYCAGLGQVAPPVEAGAAVPGDVLRRTTNPVTVTVGGVSARVDFAGLTPGFTGLYQVNIVMPQGVRAGDQVPVVLTVGDIASPPVTIAVR